MDWQTQIVKSFIDHAPLVMGLAIVAWWGFPKLYDKVLNNGGGKKLRDIIDSANEAQSVKTKEMVKAEIAVAIQVHEEVERANVERMLTELRREVTGEYPLEPRLPDRRQNRRARARAR